MTVVVVVAPVDQTMGVVDDIVVVVPENGVVVVVVPENGVVVVVVPENDVVVVVVPGNWVVAVDVLQWVE
jgi:hypothetical protein